MKICDPNRFQAKVDPDKCSFCETCRERCNFGAIEETENDKGESVMAVIGEKCLGCGLCHVTCHPEEAISLAGVREVDFIP